MRGRDEAGIFDAACLGAELVKGTESCLIPSLGRVDEGADERAGASRTTRANGIRLCGPGMVRMEGDDGVGNDVEGGDDVGKGASNAPALLHAGQNQP